MDYGPAADFVSISGWIMHHPLFDGAAPFKCVSSGCLGALLPVHLGAVGGKIFWKWNQWRNLTQCYEPATIFDTTAPCMDPLLSLFRSHQQRVALPHRSDATLFRLSYDATIMPIIICVMVPLLVNLLLWNPLIWKSLTPPPSLK